MVVYAGGHADRALIKRHEFRFPSAPHRRAYRFNVLLTSYEVPLKDSRLADHFCRSPDRLSGHLA